MDGRLLAAAGTAFGQLGENGPGRAQEAPLFPAQTPVQPERPPIPTPLSRPPSSRKSILIPVAIAILLLVVAAGWYLGHPHGKPQTKMSEMEWNTDRLGADYTGFSLPTDNPKECEDACRSDEKCR